MRMAWPPPPPPPPPRGGGGGVFGGRGGGAAGRGGQFFLCSVGVGSIAAAGAALLVPADRSRENFANERVVVHAVALSDQHQVAPPRGQARQIGRASCRER